MARMVIFDLDETLGSARPERIPFLACNMQETMSSIPPLPPPNSVLTEANVISLAFYNKPNLQEAYEHYRQAYYFTTIPRSTPNAAPLNFCILFPQKIYEYLTHISNNPDIHWAIVTNATYKKDAVVCMLKEFILSYSSRAQPPIPISLFNLFKPDKFSYANQKGVYAWKSDVISPYYTTDKPYNEAEGLPKILRIQGVVSQQFGNTIPDETLLIDNKIEHLRELAWLATTHDTFARYDLVEASHFYSYPYGGDIRNYYGTLVDDKAKEFFKKAFAGLRTIGEKLGVSSQNDKFSVYPRSESVSDKFSGRISPCPSLVGMDMPPLRPGTPVAAAPSLRDSLSELTITSPRPGTPVAANPGLRDLSHLV